MKRLSVIFLTLLYLGSVSGIAVTNFYCCGKLADTYVFNYSDLSQNCTEHTLTSGCCDYKTNLLKIKDSHSAAEEFNINVLSSDFIALNNLFIEVNHSSDNSLLISRVNSPPLINNSHIYLSVRNFRI